MSVPIYTVEEINKIIHAKDEEINKIIHAKDEEIRILRKENQELKEEVKMLKEDMKKLNERISVLSQGFQIGLVNCRNEYFMEISNKYI